MAQLAIRIILSKGEHEAFGRQKDAKVVASAYTGDLDLLRGKVDVLRD